MTLTQSFSAGTLVSSVGKWLDRGISALMGGGGGAGAGAAGADSGEMGGYGFTGKSSLHVAEATQEWHLTVASAPMLQAPRWGRRRGGARLMP